MGALGAESFKGGTGDWGGCVGDAGEVGKLTEELRSHMWQGKLTFEPQLLSQSTIRKDSAYRN